MNIVCGIVGVFADFRLKTELVFDIGPPLTVAPELENVDQRIVENQTAYGFGIGLGAAQRIVAATRSMAARQSPEV